MTYADKPGRRLPELVEVMARLLGPDGCPWDREQTLGSLAPYLLEETYELLEAIETGGPAEHREELGDLLMQIVFQAALQARDGAFTIDDVIAGITEKLIRRHPHVFGDASADSTDTVLAQWEQIKAVEKAGKPDANRLLAGVPAALPALQRAQKLTARAARVGFDWPDVGGCLAKLQEEIGELEEAMAAGDDAATRAELGDILFSAVNLARKLGHDAETALRGTTRRFSERFAYIEDRLRERGLSPDEASLEDMDRLWEESKISPLEHRPVDLGRKIT